MKISLMGAVGALSLLLAAPALADSIDFAQYGAPGTSVASGASGVTRGGVGFTISDAYGFSEYVEDYTHSENYSWGGEFNPGEIILFNNGDSGPTTISFSTPISSIVHIEAQANDYGAFTEYMSVYDGSNLLATISADAFNAANTQAAEGTETYLNYISGTADITSIVLSTTDAGAGFALGGTGGVGGAVPEPATWAMMLMGFGGMGAAMRSARRQKRAVA